MEAPTPLTNDQIEAELKGLELLNLTSVEIFGKMGTDHREAQLDEEIDRTIALYKDVDLETIPDSLKQKMALMTPHIVDVIAKLRSPDISVPKSLKLVKKTLEIFSNNKIFTNLQYTGPTEAELYQPSQGPRHILHQIAETLLAHFTQLEEALRQGERTLSPIEKQEVIDQATLIADLLEKVAASTSTPAKRAEALTLLKIALKIATLH